MDRVTLSLRPEHTALLDRLQDKWGETSRSATARRLFDEYEDRMKTSHDSSHDVHTDFTRRLDELEERVAAVEAAAGSDRSDGAERRAVNDERDGGADTDTPSEPSVSGDVSADVAAAVAAVAESWDDDPERLADRKAAAAAVLGAALEGDALSRSEAVDRFYETHAVAGQNERTWWRKNVRPVLRQYGSYSQGQQGYVVDDLD